MWAKNVLFVGLVAAGLIALGAALFPPAAPPRVRGFQPAARQEPSFHDAVAEVDAAFRQGWTDQSLQAAPKASDLAIARRLSLALTGTIPSLQEIRQFEAQESGQRLDWWLAGLLQDRRFADYFAERFARTYVGTEDGPFIIYRRRRFVSWLSDQFFANRPYDEIVRELIADEGLWTDKPATNFVTVTSQPDNKKGPDAERLAGRVARAFLGVRLDCAQCHNHPYATWKQLDFQGLAAFFGQAHQGFTGIYDGGGEYQMENRKTGGKERVEPHVPFLPELLPEQGSRRQRLAAWITDARNPYFARATVNRVWALLCGKPLVEPVDDVLVNGEVPRPLELLAVDFATHHFDLQRLIRLIAATQAFQLDSAADFEITDLHERQWAAFPITRMRPEQVVGALLQAGDLQTINGDSHIFTKAGRYFRERDFVQRYGDTGEDEFTSRGGTIPQRLLLMNGDIVKDKTKEDVMNAATRIGWLAPDDRSAVEISYLAVLTRRPTPEEAAHFEARVAGSKGNARSQHLEDLCWALLNSSEFSWNH